MTIDCVYYADGKKQAEAPASLADAAAMPHRGGNYLWLELREPTTAEMEDVRRTFDLHELAVEDAALAHQRPKVEGYDNFYLVVYKTARWEAARQDVAFGELDIFIGVGYVIVVRHGDAGRPEVSRRRLEQHPELVKTGPAAAVWSILDAVVDDYRPVVEALENAIDAIELAVFGGREDLTERIYQLKQQVNEVYRAVHPLLAPLEMIERGAFPQMDAGLKRYFRDIADHVRRLHEEVIAQREQLASALEANLALISVRQNEISAQQNQIVKQLTVVATVFLPLSFVTGFFGQNFAWLVSEIASETMFWVLGIGGLALPCVALYFWFRRSGLARS